MYGSKSGILVVAIQIISIVLMPSGNINPGSAYDNDGVIEPVNNKVKADILYNFARFVEWPADVLSDSDDVITLCIIGKDPMLETFEHIGGKKIRGRKLVINQITEIEDYGFSHILFISTTEQKRIDRILAKIHDRSVLTIGNMKGFTDSGGIISLIEKDKKVFFEINRDAAKKAHLKLSSKLLNLSKTVYRGEKGLGK